MQVRNWTRHRCRRHSLKQRPPFLEISAFRKRPSLLYKFRLFANVESGSAGSLVIRDAQQMWRAANLCRINLSTLFQLRLYTLEKHTKAESNTTLV